MEDHTIISLFFNRDETAILEIKNKYGGYCFSIANNILRIKEDSEECLNDMYNIAWRSIPPQTPNKLGVWLGKVVRNLAINLWNKNHRQKRYGGIILLLDELEECIPDLKLVEHEVEGNELTNILNNWLTTLSKEDRVLFMRRYWNGEQLQVLEKEYRISHGKMAKRMYNLRINLKATLEREGFCL